MSVVKQKTTTTDHVIRPGQSNVIIKIPLSENAKASDIQNVSPGCSCTAKVTWDDDYITAVYTDNTPVHQVQSTPLKTRTIKKWLRVLHNDGKPEKVKRPGKGMIFNPDKSHEIVYFEVTVSLQDKD